MFKNFSLVSILAVILLLFSVPIMAGGLTLDAGYSIDVIAPDIDLTANTNTINSPDNQYSETRSNKSGYTLENLEIVAASIDIGEPFMPDNSGWNPIATATSIGGEPCPAGIILSG